MSKLDPNIIKVLLIAGIPEEIATDRDVALADTFLMRANGNILLAARMLNAYRRERKK